MLSGRRYNDSKSMTGALLILAFMIVSGALLYVTDVKYFRHHHAGSPPQPSSQEEETASENPQNNRPPEICCGQHLVCEKTNLTVTSDEIIYYDDEELDRFVGRSPESYSNQEIEEFRDVLLTLLPQDVSGWAKSITLRQIELPLEIKDELLMLVADIREGVALTQ